MLEFLSKNHGVPAVTNIEQDGSERKLQPVPVTSVTHFFST